MWPMVHRVLPYLAEWLKFRCTRDISFDWNTVRRVKSFDLREYHIVHCVMHALVSWCLAEIRSDVISDYLQRISIIIGNHDSTRMKAELDQLSILVPGLAIAWACGIIDIFIYFSAHYRCCVFISSLSISSTLFYVGCACSRDSRPIVRLSRLSRKSDLRWCYSWYPGYAGRSDRLFLFDLVRGRSLGLSYLFNLSKCHDEWRRTLHDSLIWTPSTIDSRSKRRGIRLVTVKHRRILFHEAIHAWIASRCSVVLCHRAFSTFGRSSNRMRISVWQPMEWIITVKARLLIIPMIMVFTRIA